MPLLLFISEEKGKRGSRIVTLYGLIFLPYIVFFDLLFTLIRFRFCCFSWLHRRFYMQLRFWLPWRFWFRPLVVMIIMFLLLIVIMILLLLVMVIMMVMIVVLVVIIYYVTIDLLVVVVLWVIVISKCYWVAVTDKRITMTRNVVSTADMLVIDNKYSL
jgi:hypothetical protein